VVSATPADYDLDILCDTVGFPDASADHRLVDETGADVPPGVDGEIWLRGRGVFLGYWNDPTSSEAVRAPGGWLRTGDIAHARADGAWVLTGRKSEMFKSGGYNIYPREIELALETYPGVAVAVVVAVRDPRYFEVGTAFVVPKAGAGLSAEELSAHLRGRLANYKVPKTIHIRRDLPMLPIGKIDKRALIEQAATTPEYRSPA
jgi:acyl-CoA synthetase (AMP-forming)/AMP-acid ligase II